MGLMSLKARTPGFLRPAAAGPICNQSRSKAALGLWLLCHRHLLIPWLLSALLEEITCDSAV